MKNKTHFFLVATSLLMALGNVPNSFSGTPEKHLIVKIPMGIFKSLQKEIREAGLDFAGMNTKKNTVDLIVALSDFDSLRKLGITNLLSQHETSQRAPDSKYKTPDQVATLLAGFQSSYPGIAQVTSIGKSLQCRDILAIRITQNVSQPDGSKPTILFNGMHHARE